LIHFKNVKFCPISSLLPIGLDTPVENRSTLSGKYFISTSWKLQVLVFSICIFCCLPSKTRASGFGLFTNGAAELGMMNAVISNTLGPASNFFNPALITALEGTQVVISSTMIAHSTEFRSNSPGQNIDSDSEVNYPSALFLTHKIDDKFTLGFGVNNTFGLSTEWPEDWEGRYITTKCEMKTFNINPNLAWDVTDYLSMAAGVDILMGDATMKQNLNLSLYGLPDGRQRFRGDGEGYGYNLGVLYKIVDDVSLGISYRSGIKLKINGNVKFDLPQGLPPMLAEAFPNAEGGSTIELPSQLHCGLSYKPLDNILFEIGGRWEGWSSYDKLKIKFNRLVAGSSSCITLKNWGDTYLFVLGVKYNPDPTLALFAGYARGEDPVPDDTFDPAIPVSNSNDFSLGVQKTWGNFSYAICYLYHIYRSREKDNDIGASSGLTANGRYKTDAHLVGASVAYRF